jgi:hypothetical protein
MSLRFKYDKQEQIQFTEAQVKEALMQYVESINPGLIPVDSRLVTLEGDTKTKYDFQSTYNTFTLEYKPTFRLKW